MQEVSPQLVALTETHLDDGVASSEFVDTSKFEVYRKDRDSSGGGVAFLVDITLAPYTRVIYESYDIIAINITYNGHSLDVCCYYRRPCFSDFIAFKEYLNFREVNNLKGSHVVLGDFNLPGIDWSNQRVISRPALNGDFLDTLTQHDLSQLVRDSTHSQGNILDLLLVDDPDNVLNCEILPGISDHYALAIKTKNFLCVTNKLPLANVRRDYQIHKGNAEVITNLIVALGLKISQMVHSK
jgi:hypothetical protein